MRGLLKLIALCLLLALLSASHVLKHFLKDV